MTSLLSHTAHMLKLAGRDGCRSSQLLYIVPVGDTVTEYPMTLDLEKITGPHDVDVPLASKRATVVGNSPEILF